jgi:hypothetical protein
MGRKMIYEKKVIKLWIIKKIDYGKLKEWFILMLLDIFKFKIVLNIICKYIQNILVCCKWMNNEMVLIYKKFE